MRASTNGDFSSVILRAEARIPDSKSNGFFAPLRMTADGDHGSRL